MTPLLPLKVINLWVGPGGGKSTTAAGLFNAMKMCDLKVELVTEYAKDLTYAKDYGSLENQLLILAEQDRRLRRLVGHVDWAITDSPLPMGLVYMTAEYRPWLPSAVLGAYHRYQNLDFHLIRKKPFQAYGRNQNEEEARDLDRDISRLFHTCTAGGCAWTVDGDEFAPHRILAHLNIAGTEAFLGDTPS